MVTSNGLHTEFKRFWRRYVLLNANRKTFIFVVSLMSFILISWYFLLYRAWVT